MYPGIKRAACFLGVFALVWLAIRFLLPLFLPFVLGGVLALAAEPMVGFLCRRLRLPRPAGAGIGVAMVFCLLALLVLTLCALVIRELGVLAGVLPNLEETAKSGMAMLSDWLLGLTRHLPQGIRGILDRNITGLFSGGSALLDQAVRYVLNLASGILSHVPDSALTLGTGVISSFMISAKLPKIRSWLRSRFPRERLRPWLETWRRIRTALSGWLLAQFKLSLVTWGLVCLGFWILGIPYAPLWAGVVALVDAFPILGTGTILLPWALVCLLQGSSARAVGLVCTYLVVALTRSTLEPRLVGKQLGLDPLVTLMALYIGYQLWGLGGMILSPLLAVTAMQLLPGKPRSSP